MEREISLKKFIYHFCDKQRVEKKFCFVLGAGASKASGIPTGAEMVKNWIAELEQADKEDLEIWLEAEGIREDQYAANYPKIFDKRFELSRKDGFAYLEETMKNAEPSCGYSVLAQVLAEGKHNVVITTNFDSLIEDALFVYTQKKPLVIGHAALANYININLSRPLVVKVHHDLLLSPKNTAEEVWRMDDNFAKNLKDIFKSYTPLVIGYGGNDGSLMKFLSGLEYMQEGIYWFYLDEREINPEVVQLVNQMKGYFVKIRSFDDLMIRLSEQLKYERLDGKIVEIAQKRGESYRKQIERLKQSEATECETKSAVDNIVARGKRDWWYYALLADGENDKEKADRIYREGLDEFPQSSELNDEYANFLCEVRKEYAEAEKYYLRALELDADNAEANGNYAVFLYEVKKNYPKAEEYYLKSFGLDANNAIANGNYANFLYNVRKDHAGAEKYYLKSLGLDADSAVVNGNYADFLCRVKKDYSKAEKYYLRALELDASDAVLVGNYADFLCRVKKDYPKAEKYYLKVLKLDANNANVNGNYANFLHDVKKDQRGAQKYYLKALELDGDNVMANVNYADFLCEVKKDYAGAERYYLKSLELDGDNAVVNGNYAKYLLVTGKKAEALNYITKAFEYNKQEKDSLALELWFYCYAVFSERYPQSKEKIEELLAMGIDSLGWELGDVLKIAEEQGHRDMEGLRRFAKRISEGASEKCRRGI